MWLGQTVFSKARCQVALGNALSPQLHCLRPPASYLWRIESRLRPMRFGFDSLRFPHSAEPGGGAADDDQEGGEEESGGDYGVDAVVEGDGGGFEVARGGFLQVERGPGEEAHARIG